MFLIYNLFLFLITVAGGSFPLWNRSWNEQKMKYLLAFSGSFLLGITLLHLVPETMEKAGHKAGMFILCGFFLQQMIQRFTHGVEHGHAHIDDHHHHVPILPVFAGLAIHAFSEGLPLGIHYSDQATLPSLYAAIALHKLPEAMLITSLISAGNKANKNKAWLLLIIFSAITPVAGILTAALGARYSIVHNFVDLCIPIIAGAFIHIATTIFFESGTKSHDMNWKKWSSVLLGIGFALITLLGNSH
ncbi:MAG: ZIP family metal transporter [Taibaiella sp.]|jgi:zinc transporter ZupT